MRAAVVNATQSFEIAELPDPIPEADELVLQVTGCGICGSDLKTAADMPAGSVLGHEFCGEVVAVGKDVRDLWHEGDFAASMPLSACGRCRWCVDDQPAHCESLELIGLGERGGGFAEYVRVGASTTARLPRDVGRHGAMVEPLAVGLHAVRAAAVREGDHVLVIGGGSIGSAASLWARRAGAARIVVSDPAPHRRDTADVYGATDVHDPSSEPLPAGFDVVIECVGLPGMLQAAVNAVATGGRIAMAGLCVGEERIFPLTAMMKEVKIGYAVFYRQSEFVESAEALAKGLPGTDLWVTSTVGLGEVGAAFDTLHGTNTERKVLVVPDAN